MDEIRKSHQEELDRLRQLLKKARVSTDQAAAEQVMGTWKYKAAVKDTERIWSFCFPYEDVSYGLSTPGRILESLITGASPLSDSVLYLLWDWGYDWTAGVLAVYMWGSSEPAELYHSMARKKGLLGAQITKAISGR